MVIMILKLLIIASLFLVSCTPYESNNHLQSMKYDEESVFVEENPELE
jgi:hypothetical protein